MACAPAVGLMLEFRLSIFSTSSLAFGLMCFHSRSGKSTCVHMNGRVNAMRSGKNSNVSGRTLEVLTRRSISWAVLPQNGA